MKKLVIGTRGSKLALCQAEIIRTALMRAHPELAIEIKIIKTEGDVNLSPIPLDTMGKGWFTKEIEEELLAGTIDVAAHSLKDMPEEQPAGLALVSYPEREDARDVLVTRDGRGLTSLAEGAKIGTDSERRRAQILAMRTDLVIESIRGNVPTRIEKMDEGGYDAVVLAAAGLKRLHIEDRIAQIFEVDEVTPAPGQGILALEARDNDSYVLALLTSIDNEPSRLAARAERAFSRAIGGGCKTPVGAYASFAGTKMSLIGMLAKGDGSSVLRRTVSGDASKPEELSENLAKAMRKEAPWYHPAP